MTTSARPTLTLLRSGHPLADPSAQRRRLRELPVVPSFDEAAGELRACSVDVLQVNLGKRCNQTCAHCHVDAGPDRVEVMSDDVVDACLRVLERDRIPTLDITGGAPELHPRFEELVVRARAAGARVIDRCNLTVLLTAPHAHLTRLLADHDVDVVCSLPFWDRERTDAQRGAGVFDNSIEALRRLNDVGYGDAHRLVLVANPTGAFLPAPQASLERDFRRALDKLGVRFTALSALTNMPIARFLEWLDRTGNTERYVHKLAAAFNPGALPGVMCRSHVSVSWDGRLWDCDFNQMIELPPVDGGSIFDFDAERWARRRIATDVHCYGCTAGQGSSCGGALVSG